MEIEEQKRIAKANGDKPAFPVYDGIPEGEKWVGRFVPDAGLTKREYFAGIALGAFTNKSGEFNSMHVCDAARGLADELLFQLAGEIEDEGYLYKIFGG